MGHECGQSSQQVHRLQAQVGGAIAIGCFQLQEHLAVRGEGESLFGHGGPAEVATQPFEFAAGVRLGGDASVRGEPAGLRECVALL